MNWCKDFCRSLPREFKEWNKSTIEGIQLPIGMRTDGELNNLEIVLTDEQPHALVVMPDASDLILSLICTLTNAYSPLMLQLHFFDLSMKMLPSLLAHYNAQTGTFEAPNRHSAMRSFTLRSPLPHLDLYNESSSPCETKAYYEILKLRMIQAGVNLSNSDSKNLHDLLTSVYAEYVSEHAGASWKDMLTDDRWYLANVVEKYNSLARRLVIINSIDDIYEHDVESLDIITYLMDNATMCGYHFLIIANRNVNTRLKPFIKRCDTVIRYPGVFPKGKKIAVPATEREVCVQINGGKISNWEYPSISTKEINYHLATMTLHQKSCSRKATYKNLNW